MNRQQRRANRGAANLVNNATIAPKLFISSGFENNFIGTPPTVAADPQKNTVNHAFVPKVLPLKAEVADVVIDDGLKEEPEDGANTRPWYRVPNSVKRKPSVRQRRIRRNRTLRKLLTPKNALMALYELKGNQLSEFTIVPDEKGFVATIDVNGKAYDGRGISKVAAKNCASEQALRDLIIQKMITIPKGQQAASATPSVVDDDMEMVDANETSEDAEEEVPMMHLASFALHKLFTGWQAEGYAIPDFKTGPAPIVKAEVTPRETVRTELPLNYETMHPSMLLALMRPSTQYVELGHEGITPNIIHRIGVYVDGQQFVGAARSKKLARKDAAAKACNGIFQSNFPFDKQLVPSFA